MVDIKSVGVIGAGQMGSGIAHVAAVAGYDVLLHDVSADRIEAGIKSIEQFMARMVARGFLKHEEMESSL
jgi:3-hydroxybutyryl-CoA dehydrogenase